MSEPTGRYWRLFKSDLDCGRCEYRGVGQGVFAAYLEQGSEDAEPWLSVECLLDGFWLNGTAEGEAYVQAIEADPTLWPGEHWHLRGGPLDITPQGVITRPLDRTAQQPCYSADAGTCESEHRRRIAHLEPEDIVSAHEVLRFGHSGPHVLGCCRCGWQTLADDEESAWRELSRHLAAPR